VNETEEIVWEGRFLTAKRKGKWEYVSRTRGVSAAVILAIVDGDVLLVEQDRAPLNRRCLELPAGLVGDEQQGEAVETAAARELEEETGFRAERMVELGQFHASPGMSSEHFTLLRAEGLTKIGEGGGVGSEAIDVYRIPLGEVPGFVDAKRREGVAIDVKLLILLAGQMLSGQG